MGDRLEINGSKESDAKPRDITLLLRQWSEGDAHAGEEIVRILYPQLKRIAAYRMRAERPDHTLQPTAIVNEFFLHLARNQQLGWKNRSHFLALASRVIRRVLIDYSRAHSAGKRSSNSVKIQLDGLQLPGDLGCASAIEINDLMEQLAKQDERMAKVVEMRCFGGLTHEEIAEALEIAERTVKRDWQVARAWLAAQLRKNKSNAGSRLGAS